MAETTTPGVYGAIAKVIGALSADGIAKNKTNAQQGYSFRGIDDVYGALSAQLHAANLVIMPRVLRRECTEGATKSGGKQFTVVVDVEWDVVYGGDGSAHTIKTFGEAMDSADKATNKAMSAAYKYMAIMLFCIPVEGLPDADASTPETSIVKPEPAKPTHGARTPEPTNVPPADAYDPARKAQASEFMKSLHFDADVLAKFKADCKAAGVDFRDVAIEAKSIGVDNCDGLFDALKAWPKSTEGGL